MSAKTCVRCGQRNAASNADVCLSCAMSGAQAQPAASQDDGEVSCTLAYAGMFCERCGAPARPINLFGGGGHYVCTAPSCLHQSESALEQP